MEHISKTVIEELYNIAINQPVFHGNTISHQTANELCELGYIKRDENGDWIINYPTNKPK